MSLAKNDRKVRSKSGKSFPESPAHAASLASAIAAALRKDFDGRASSVKAVGRLANANERAVRNWFDGKNAPSGENLVCLIRHSDAVLEVILSMAGRRDLTVAIGLMGLGPRLRELADAIDLISAP